MPPGNPRFNFHTNSAVEAEEYLRNRAIQGLADGAIFLEFSRIGNWGVRALVELDSQLYQAVYVLNEFRGKGLLTDYAQKSPIPFITIPDCEIENYFKSKKIHYRVIGRFTLTQEYKAIAEYYGYTRAKRSGVPFMNHIDEGLAVLNDIKASDEAKAAYCLHPLFQEEKDLLKNYSHPEKASSNSKVILLAIEYRNIANGYLSRREIASLEEIYLGPLPEVRDMLIADKVQNYKDFLTYHSNNHPRKEQLDKYFKNWLKKLGISLARFEEWCKKLTIKV